MIQNIHANSILQNTFEDIVAETTVLLLHNRDRDI
jgi:hypothetical protein